VVVDRHTLVWLNPAADQPVWKYVSDGHGIESPPRLIDGKLVVADLAGRLTAIDPATGKPVGGGYQITAEAAPSAITAYGAGRLFAPLTDGTVLVLPIAELGR
jgi:outer membrane protein assembly factor BamB